MTSLPFGPVARTGRPVGGRNDAGQQHGPVGVGHGEHHRAVFNGIHVGGSRPGLRNLQRLDRTGGGPVRSDRLAVDRRPFQLKARPRSPSCSTSRTRPRSSPVRTSSRLRRACSRTRASITPSCCRISAPRCQSRRRRPTLRMRAARRKPRSPTPRAGTPTCCAWPSRDRGGPAAFWLRPTPNSPKATRRSSRSATTAVSKWVSEQRTATSSAVFPGERTTQQTEMAAFATRGSCAKARATSGAKQFGLTNTRYVAGINEYTAPQGATVAGGSSKRYTFHHDLAYWGASWCEHEGGRRLNPHI